MRAFKSCGTRNTFALSFKPPENGTDSMQLPSWAENAWNDLALRARGRRCPHAGGLTPRRIIRIIPFAKQKPNIEKMKRTLIGAALAAIGILSIAAIDNSQQPKQHECVVLFAYQIYGNSYPVTYDSIRIFSSSSSSNAPHFNQYVQDAPVTNMTTLADGLVQCLNAGFHITQSTGDGLAVTLMK